MGPRHATARAAPVAGWAVAAVFVLGVYFAVVIGGSRLFGQAEATHLTLALLATVIVALALEGVRRRAHTATARLLATPVTEPYRVLSRFADHLVDARSVEEMTGRMARVLAEGTSTAWVQVWLSVHSEMRLVASWPPDVPADRRPPPLVADHRHGRHSIPVGHGGETLGVLRLQEHDGRPLTAVEARLLAGLAGQAGLLLAKARLQAELSARVEQLSAQAATLRAARSELVTASDVERRRLERDLHDGAQQELVALSINLALARTLVGRDPSVSRRLLADQADAAEAAIATLTTLSRGLRPAVLVAGGLPAALREIAGSSALPVTLDVDRAGRYTAPVETAVYYCASEALQNALKHSGATAVALTLDEQGTDLVLTVADDGSGRIPRDVRAGTGLRSMRERASGVGGSLRVEGRAGAGTTVTLTIPTVRQPPVVP